METKNIKSVKLFGKKEHYMWEGTKIFNSMIRTLYILSAEGNGKNHVKSRLSTNSYLVPINNDDYIVKIFKDEIGTGISILRVINILNTDFIEVEVVSRKTANSEILIKNQYVKEIPEITLNKINFLINKT